MECEQVIQRLWAYLDRELDEETFREIEAHVRECLNCGPHAEFERRLRQMVQASAAQERVPATLRQRLWRLLDENAVGAAPTVEAQALTTDCQEDAEQDCSRR